MTTYMIVIKLFITLEYLFSDNTDDFYMRVKPHWKVRNSGIDWNGCHDGFRADEELIHFCKILKYDITQISQICFCPNCGSTLPDIKLVSPLPDKIHIDDDGYCKTCEERIRNCICVSPLELWEIDKQTKK